MPWSLDADEVSIGSGSMSHTFRSLTAQRFSSSLSRNRVPDSSGQALAGEKTFAVFLQAPRGDEMFEVRMINDAQLVRCGLLLCEAHACVTCSPLEPSFRRILASPRVGKILLRLRRA